MKAFAITFILLTLAEVIGRLVQFGLYGRLRPQSDLDRVVNTIFMLGMAIWLAVMVWG